MVPFRITAQGSCGNSLNLGSLKVNSLIPSAAVGGGAAAAYMVLSFGFRAVGLAS